MRSIHNLQAAIVVLGIYGIGALGFGAEEYHKATEGKEVVMNKLYPKDGRVELSTSAGAILNQSYVQTYLMRGGIQYYLNEEWGIAIEGLYAINQDKGERQCLEYFYNDPKESVAADCGEASNLPAGGNWEAGPNYGPAYVGIRELKYIVQGGALWNPVYGKQILFLTFTNHFDIFVTLAGGLAFADYYPTDINLRNGRQSRAKPFTDNTSTNPGCDPRDSTCYGEAGRPDPESETSPLINLGIGQKFHFMKLASLHIDLRNYTLLGTSSGFDNFFTLWGGLGVRF